MLLAAHAPNHPGVSLARRFSWCMFGASPALPTKDAQPGQRLSLFQGSSTSAVSNICEHLCAAERQTSLPASPSCSPSAQLALLLQDLAPLTSQSFFLWVKCASSQQQWPPRAPTAPTAPPHLAHPTVPVGWLITPRDVHAAALWPGSTRRGFHVPEAGAGEVRAGSHQPGGGPALAASRLGQLGGVESQCVMEELVLLTRLDHPSSARERQGPLTGHQTQNPVPSSLLPGHKHSCFTCRVKVPLKQAPEQPKE